MRSYPTNSPQALARLLAMAVIADGDLDDLEMSRLRELDIYGLIGIEADGFYQVLLQLCHDLWMAEDAPGVSLLAAERLDQLAAEVDQPALRKLVLSAMLVAAKADGRVTGPEQRLLRFLLDRWQIPLDGLRIA